MYICLCNAVTDTDIQDAVLSGTTELRDLQTVLGVSTGCGTCQEAAQQVISDVLANSAGHLSYAV